MLNSVELKTDRIYLFRFSVGLAALCYSCTLSTDRSGLRVWDRSLCVERYLLCGVLWVITLVNVLFICTGSFTLSH